MNFQTSGYTNLSIIVAGCCFLLGCSHAPDEKLTWKTITRYESVLNTTALRTGIDNEPRIQRIDTKDLIHERWIWNSGALNNYYLGVDVKYLKHADPNLHRSFEHLTLSDIDVNLGFFSHIIIDLPIKNRIRQVANHNYTYVTENVRNSRTKCFLGLYKVISEVSNSITAVINTNLCVPHGMMDEAELIEKGDNWIRSYSLKLDVKKTSH